MALVQRRSKQGVRRPEGVSQAQDTWSPHCTCQGGQKGIEVKGGGPSRTNQPTAPQGSVPRPGTPASSCGLCPAPARPTPGGMQGPRSQGDDIGPWAVLTPTVLQGLPADRAPSVPTLVPLCSQRRDSCTSWAKVWMTTRLFHLSARTRPPRRASQVAPHSPSLWDPASVPRGHDRQSRGRKPSPSSPVLCRGARAHPQVPPGPGWDPGSEGAAWLPQP